MPIQFATWIFLSLLLYLFLALIHMLGHLLASRALNARMEEAIFGIGPNLFKLWRTKLVVRIPLIYCEELVFEQPTEGKSETTTVTHTKLELFWRKTIVLAAGPIVSFILAASILAFISSSGTPVFLPNIGQVRSGSPAEKAGLKQGDRIISVENRTITSWDEMAELIANSSAAPVQLQVERDNNLLTITVLPEVQIIQNAFGEPEHRPMVGIAWSGEIELKKPSVWQLPKIGIVQASALIRYRVEQLLSITRTPPAQSTLGGPIGIMKSATDDVAVFRFVLYNVASLSASIAFLTLLPLPIFDGGQFLYLLIETIRGKQISSKTKRRFRLLSIILLLALAALAFLLDLADLLLLS